MSRREKFQSMGYRGGTSRKAAQTRRYPLRKVVDEFAHETIEVGASTLEIERVELECGHKLSPPNDIIGRRYPARMRCRHCYRAEQEAADIDPEEGESNG